MHAASTHENAGFRPSEAGLHGLRGRQLRCAISNLGWGASQRPRRVQTLLVRFLLAPLEFPKLANAQPSNFGPLRILLSKFGYYKKTCKREMSEKY